MKKIILATLFVFFAADFAKAEGYLFISPQRLNLSDKNKIGQLHLVNKSDDKKTYTIKVLEYQMNAKNSLEIADDLPYSAKKFIRYSPRRVTLEPGADQYVRIMARLPKDTEEGSYHAHVEFEEVPGAHVRENAKKEEAEGNTASFAIGAAYGIAIPVFVSKGQVSTEMKIVGAKAQLNSDKETGELYVDFSRSGNGSGYRLATVNYIDSSGNKHSAGSPSRISMYREIDKATKKMKLELPEGVKFDGGELEVILSGIDSKEDEVDRIDEYRVQIN